MDFIKRHWLGLAVLLMFGWAMLSMFANPHEKINVPAAFFAIFLVVWLFRGFIRFLGRAWRHSASNTR